jgi:cytochrome P450
MQLIQDLPLPSLAVNEDWFAADPIPQLDAARAEHPWLASSPLGFVVTHYGAIRDLFKLDGQMRGNYDEMVAMMGAANTPWGDFQLGHILNAQGERHQRLRDVLAPAFTPRQANRHRQVMRDVIVELLDQWAPRGAFDFEEFASWYPITVISRMIGSPDEAIPELRDSLEALGRSVSMDLRVLAAMQEGTQRLDSYCSELIERRLAVRKPDDDNDLLDVLLRIHVEGRLAQPELVNVLTFLLVAGYDTSKNVMTMMMFELCQSPDVYAQCAADLDYCTRAVDEAMRLHGTNNMMRIVTQDIEYRDVLIPTGTTLFFPWAIAGQDPTAIAEPHAFIPDRRDQIRHLGFGLGAHMCLGQHIARAQIAEAMHLIAQRIATPRTTGPRGWRPFPGVWGMEGLPITFTPV